MQKTDQLVTEFLSRADEEEPKVSSAVRTAARLARLRNDWANLLWLEQEQVGAADKEALADIKRQLAPHFTVEQWKKEWATCSELYVAERKVRLFAGDSLGEKYDSMLAESVEEIEVRVESLGDQIKASTPPPGLAPVDLYFKDQEYAKLRTVLLAHKSDAQKVLSRIRRRVFNYFHFVEREILLGQVSSDIFMRNRAYVDARLKTIAPSALEQFAAAYERSEAGSSEALSHALTSCRRILKSVADALYPASKEPVLCLDGKTRVLNNEMYMNRLCQFAAGRSRGTSVKLVIEEVEQLSRLLKRLNELASKGVHDDVSQAEVEQCVIQTYLVVGDLLRLEDGESAISVEPENR
ncbi:hypothetical protein ABZ208_19160 [Streptomyces sp. NPDC006208]|uniref:hypothetical protein n=1 Tax=Streptomyces sp. NPDC006208 TaxID=3156734 RepID=UPI0033A5ED5E